MLLRTGRHGEFWELVFHKDRSYDKVRIDTPIEIDYYQHGGILPYVLRQIMGQALL